MPWKDDNKIWFNPAYVHSCCVEMVQKKGIDAIKKEGRLKDLSESYDLAILALIIYELNGKTHELPLLQKPKQDPPDGYIGQASKIEKGDFEISVIELTRFDEQNGKTLLDQLIDSGKIGVEFNKYGKEYILAVKIEEGLEPNYVEVNQFLKKAKIPFAVWALQIIQNSPDTIAKLTILNPEIQIIETNIGRTALQYKLQNVPNVQEMKRVGSKEKVRKEIGTPLDAKYLNPEFGWIIDQK